MGDNTPGHRATPARECINQNEIKKLPWYTYSPDLNQLENVWIMMKYYIQDNQWDFEHRSQQCRAETVRG